jgi:hypothetical protein
MEERIVFAPSFELRGLNRSGLYSTFGIKGMRFQIACSARESNTPAQYIVVKKVQNEQRMHREGEENY